MTDPMEAAVGAILGLVPIGYEMTEDEAAVYAQTTITAYLAALDEDAAPVVPVHLFEVARKFAEAHLGNNQLQNMAGFSAQQNEKLRRFLRISRKEGGEALDALTTLRAERDEARARAEVMREALKALVDEKTDYMRINKLGDPETQHTVKLARAALSPTAGQRKMNVVKQLRQDIGILLSALDRQFEATGESLDPEDNAMIDQIRLGERG